MYFLLVLIFVFCCGVSGKGSVKYPGWHPASKAPGSVWPQPQEYNSTIDYGILQPGTFQFVYKSTVQCAIVEQALVKYHDIIFKDRKIHLNRVRRSAPKEDGNNLGNINILTIDVAETTCPSFPSLGMDESYNLQVFWDSLDDNANVLTANTTWGVLRGLETFSQLVHSDAQTLLPRVNQTSIVDFPRFSHRGVLLDSSRHFLPINLIYKALDGMAANKFNVFHWHIVDDQSFPFQSVRYPELSEYGAYNPYTHVYTHAEIGAIIDHARYLGIRVMPEFDTPGHVGSWGEGIKGILTECYKNESGSQVLDGFGPLNPIVNKTYEVLQNLLTEVASLFPEKYIHLGGDEVPFDCWESNPAIKDYMVAHNYSDDYTLLEDVYITKLLDIVENLSIEKSYIVWQEVFDNNIELKEDTVVHVWKDGSMPEMFNVTEAGFQTILSSCWYLDYVISSNDWARFYGCDPLGFEGTPEQEKLVIGGEAALWGEFADSTNVLARLFPRALATAERLWSPANVNDVQKATPRLETQRCRMIARGIPAEPQAGPGFCDIEYNDVLI